MTDKKTSISIDPKVWRDFKIYCIKRDISVSEMLERIMQGQIERKFPLAQEIIDNCDKFNNLEFIKWYNERLKELNKKGVENGKRFKK